jgi:hypothetical protein
MLPRDAALTAQGFDVKLAMDGKHRDMEKNLRKIMQLSAVVLALAFTGAVLSDAHAATDGKKTVCKMVKHKKRCHKSPFKPRSEVAVKPYKKN